jgi:phosphate-induced protein 1
MKTNVQILLLLVMVSFVWLGQPALAQSVTASQRPTGTVKTDSRILYHDGPVMIGSSNIYLIWYGCWDNNCGLVGNVDTQLILSDFTVSVGSTPYFQILPTYPNAYGQTPSGALLFGGSVVDQYSHGFELTASDLQGIVADQINGNQLPPDPAGIYVVLASADVSSPTTGFCVASAQPHHGTGFANGSLFRYAFVGNPTRCPSVGAPQFFADGTQLPTPNGSLAADAMANTLAHVLSTTITNPNGNAWFDRYGLQNADKCDGQFGPTYLTASGARANLKLGQRDYLIQENWVNVGKGHCALNQSL